jgi:nitroreductase
VDALTCLLTRRTVANLTDPGPTTEQLQTILTAAVSAPDHKMLRPWRFVVVRGEGRTTLAAAIEAAGVNAGLAEPLVRKGARKATRSPALIAVVASRIIGGKVPREEQDASAAAAAQNICLAAHALGFGSAWKSVPLADSDEVRAAFGLTGAEALLGWVELGQPAADQPRPPRERPALPEVVTELLPGGRVPMEGPAVPPVFPLPGELRPAGASAG